MERERERDRKNEAKRKNRENQTGTQTEMLLPENKKMKSATTTRRNKIVSFSYNKRGMYIFQCERFAYEHNINYTDTHRHHTVGTTYSQLGASWQVWRLCVS